MSKRISIGCAAILFMFMEAVVPSGSFAQGGALPQPLFRAAASPTLPATETHVERRRAVEFDPDALEAPELRLNLFADRDFVATRDRSQGSPAASFEWFGHIDGLPTSTVGIVVRNGVLAATVRWPGGLYEIHQAGNGAYLIEQINAAKLPPHTNPKVPPVGGLLAPSTTPTTTTTATAGDGPVIDLMILNTPAARVAEGGLDAIEAKMQLAVADLNNAYAGSLINPRINLVHIGEINYDESLGKMDKSLNNLTYVDGVIDEAHSLRDTYGADLVTMVTVDSDYCGIAWVMQSNSTSFAPYAFNVVNRSCVSNLTMAHELGHNQGSVHDRANSSIVGVYPYSYGLQYATGGWYTVMSYACGGCTRIPRFSNPNVLWNGAPTGIAYETDPTHAADNARSLNNTAVTVAAPPHGNDDAAERADDAGGDGVLRQHHRPVLGEHGDQPVRSEDRALAGWNEWLGTDRNNRSDRGQLSRRLLERLDSLLVPGAGDQFRGRFRL